jgi:hypothetical protein
MAVDVQIKIVPPQSDLTTEQLNAEFGGEIADFEKWFIERQRSRGLTAARLMSVEDAILRSFMYYAYTKGKDVG